MCDSEGFATRRDTDRTDHKGPAKPVGPDTWLSGTAAAGQQKVRVERRGRGQGRH